MGRRTRESKRLQNWYVIFYNFFSSSFIEALIIYLCVYVCSFLSLVGFHNYYVFHKGVIFIYLYAWCLNFVTVFKERERFMTLQCRFSIDDAKYDDDGRINRTGLYLV